MGDDWDMTADTTTETTTQQQQTPLYQRLPNPMMLIFGLATLFASGYILTGNWWFPSIDPRWLIAGGALVVGLLLLGASLRRR